MNVEFLYSKVLFLLILLIVLIILLSTSKNNIQRFFNTDILNKLSINTNRLSNVSRNMLFLLALVLFLLALARPIINMKKQNIKQQLIPIVIALDVSKSMMARDIYPSRLELAKKKIYDVIKLSKNTTIGIVLFAQNSYIISPITEDFISLKYIIDNMDTTLNFTNGSNIYAVLEATQQMLKNFKAKNLIILSDGGNDEEYIKELEFSKNNKINIYTIGLATKQGAPIPTQNGYLTSKDGKIVIVKLNESIKQLALKSNGGYIKFSLDNNDINSILNQIEINSKKEEFNFQKIKTYTELFYYPLSLAIFFLFLAFSSLPKIKEKFKVPMVAIMIIYSFLPFKMEASFLNDFNIIKEAKNSYIKENYKKAIKEYKKIKNSNQRDYNIANSYYKNGNYKKALDIYKNIHTKNKDLEYQKLHNIGNSYAKNNNLKKAKESYEKALKIKNDKQTSENLEMVKKAIKNKQNKQNKQDKQKDTSKKHKDKNGKKNKLGVNSKNKSNKSKAKLENNITNREEKKWLQMLKNNKTPIMLRKVQSSQYKTNNPSRPW
jgi:Ca-activated chloride channel family protein